MTAALCHQSHLKRAVVAGHEKRSTSSLLEPLRPTKSSRLPALPPILVSIPLSKNQPQRQPPFQRPMACVSTSYRQREANCRPGRVGLAKTYDVHLICEDYCGSSLMWMRHVSGGCRAGHKVFKNIHLSEMNSRAKKWKGLGECWKRRFISTLYFSFVLLFEKWLFTCRKLQ